MHRHRHRSRWVVLVLEDTPSRVDWLRKLCREHRVSLVTTARVKDFLHAMDAYRPEIVVLDHDLGGYSMPVSLQDSDGLDGIDAVERLKHFTARFLIWSTNHVEAPRMESILQSRGAATVVRASWSDERERITETLASWLT